MEPPKVFVSYSWSVAEHQARVIALADRLRRDGVDVILDKWDLKHGQDTISFMEQMVTNSDVTKVLILADRSYSEKADTRTGGVGTESQIISREVYEKVDQTKFLPIVFEVDDNGRAHLPVFFKSRFFVDFSTPERAEEQYPQLLRAIFDRPLYQRPALGSPPSYIFGEPSLRPHFDTKINVLRGMIEAGKPIVDVKVRETFEALTSNLEEFRIKAPPADRFLDDVILESVTGMTEARDNFVDLVSMLAKYHPTAATAESIGEAFAAVYSLTTRPEKESYWNDEWTDNFRILLHELFLSCAAVLIREQCEALLLPLLTTEYYVARDDEGRSFVDYTDFRTYPKSLERRNERLKLNKISPLAELLKERSTGRFFKFADLVQADFVLFLRSLISAQEVRRLWAPATIIFARETRLPLFTMAESARRARFLFRVLEVEDKKEFDTKYTAANEQNRLNDQLKVGDFWPVQISRLGNFEKLATRP